MSEIREKIAETKEATKKFLYAPKFAPAGQSTQLIVGATPSSDRQILDLSERLYRKHRLKRVYYSAFSPIPDGDPNLPLRRPPLMREHRLYQADWLIRFYGFTATELARTGDGNLELDVDPKVAWALANRAAFPVDVNTAARETLLRVPGFGVRTVDRVIELRRFRKLKLEDLGKMHVSLSKTRYFVVAHGHNPYARRLDDGDLRSLIASPEPLQLQLFESATSARTGEV